MENTKQVQENQPTPQGDCRLASSQPKPIPQESSQRPLKRKKESQRGSSVKKACLETPRITDYEQVGDLMVFRGTNAGEKKSVVKGLPVVIGGTMYKTQFNKNNKTLTLVNESKINSTIPPEVASAFLSVGQRNAANPEKKNRLCEMEYITPFRCETIALEPASSVTLVKDGSVVEIYWCPKLPKSNVIVEVVEKQVTCIKSIFACTKQALTKADWDTFMEDESKKDNPVALCYHSNRLRAEKRSEESEHLLQRAVDHGDEPAMLTAAQRCFVKGEYAEAIRLLKMMTKGHPEVFCIFGMCFVRGLGGLEQDVKRGLALLHQSAHGMYVPAFHMLAWVYTNVILSSDEESALVQSVPRNEHLAVAYLEIGAHMGCQFSMFNLALAFRYGIGVPQHNDKALKW